jgi:hypothetical protein
MVDLVSSSCLGSYGGYSPTAPATPLLRPFIPSGSLRHEPIHHLLCFWRLSFPFGRDHLSGMSSHSPQPAANPYCSLYDLHRASLSEGLIEYLHASQILLLSPASFSDAVVGCLARRRVGTAQSFRPWARTNFGLDPPSPWIPFFSVSGVLQAHACPNIGPPMQGTYRPQYNGWSAMIRSSLNWVVKLFALMMWFFS